MSRVLLSCFVVACGSTPPGVDGATTGVDASADVPASICAPSGSAGSFQKQIVVAGIERTYALRVGGAALAASSRCRAAVVVGFHGAGDTGAGFLAGTGLPATAEAKGFILAGPDAIERTWYLGAAEGWNARDGHPTSLENDVLFVRALVDEVAKTYGVDRERVYAVGFSRGGGFTGLLATASNNPSALDGRYSSPFAAYAISAGYDTFNGKLAFEDSSPKGRIWMRHGTADQAVPFTLGKAFAAQLESARWPMKFDAVSGASHAWLWRGGTGPTNEELWSFLSSESP